MCNSCKKLKTLDCFYKNKSRIDGLQYRCSKCDRKKVDNYKKTKSGILTQMYSSQKSTSVNRGHLLPNYTKKEFIKWVESNYQWEILYDSWVAFNYHTDFKPSCDRLDDYKPYTLDNLRLTIWIKNRERFYKDAKNGINNKMSKAVIRTNIKTGEEKEYYSIGQAERDVGIHHTSISYCCKGKRVKDSAGSWYTYKSAGGYFWRYKDKLKI